LARINSLIPTPAVEATVLNGRATIPLRVGECPQQPVIPMEIFTSELAKVGIKYIKAYYLA